MLSWNYSTLDHERKWGFSGALRGAKVHQSKEGNQPILSTSVDRRTQLDRSFEDDNAKWQFNLRSSANGKALTKMPYVAILKFGL
ncbi:uncharacterized protein SPSK_10170 [Sporothrix schenckii 1099-18]|uniref:Uncharacterized protein n=1 Tax=Sporothrix schenckii 1099-18 TaxID=1397361 RepID=A0A0F2M909_SPOSC|nr:uncharacterized protein SPSK_10170 [Sporothrix schenckii 1099-18]KJR84646.1 hypothetical protein SPSK_10170 [Sporothrix schenckii 1099-18]